MSKPINDSQKQYNDFKNKYVPDSHMTNHSSRKYDDIINLPHPESSSHVRMPLHDRAAQFAPFEAMEDEMKLGKDVTLLEDPADPALWACSKPKTGR